MNIQRSWIYAAINEAHKAKFKRRRTEYRLGAIIIKNGKIVGRGHNYKENGVAIMRYGNGYGIHAEHLALQRSRRRGETLVVVRILKDGRLSMAAPCSNCFRAAKENGIRNIVYSDWNGNLQTIKI